MNRKFVMVQLEDATRQFPGNRTRIRARGKLLQVSSLFKWYRDDFETGWCGARSIGAFVALYGDALGPAAAQRNELAQDGIEIEFLDYDWRLYRVP